MEEFIGARALRIVLHEEDAALIGRAADVEGVLLLAGLVVPGYLKGAVLTP